METLPLQWRQVGAVGAGQVHARIPLQDVDPGALSHGVLSVSPAAGVAIVEGGELVFSPLESAVVVDVEVTVCTADTTGTRSRGVVHVALRSEGLSTWNGGVSTSWWDPDNWTPAQVPNQTATVLIPRGAARVPEVDFAGEAGDLLVENGAALVVAPGVQLSVSRALWVAGTARPGSGLSGGMRLVGVDTTVFGELPDVTLGGAATSAHALLGDVEAGAVVVEASQVAASVTLGASRLHARSLQLGPLARLDMTDAADRVLVDDDLTWDTATVVALSAGTLTVRGDITGTGDLDAFASHQLVLDGTTAAQVTLARPSFGTVEVVTSVRFVESARVAGTLRVRGRLEICSGEKVVAGTVVLEPGAVVERDPGCGNGPSGRLVAEVCSGDANLCGLVDPPGPCDHPNAVEGDLLIRSSLEADGHANVTCVTGTLAFTPEDGADPGPLAASMTQLAVVGADLAVTNQAASWSINLPALRTVGATLRVEGNPADGALTAPQLRDATSVVVTGNAALTGMALPQLLSLDELRVETNAALTGMSFPALASLQTLTLTGNPALTSLAGLGGLLVLEAASVRNNSALSTCEVLDLRNRVQLPGSTLLDVDMGGNDDTGVVSIVYIDGGNAAAQVASHAQTRCSTGALVIANVTDALDVSFPELVTVGFERVDIVNNPALRSVSAPRLRSEGGVFNISNNASLVGVDFPVLTHLAWFLQIAGNAALSDISSLSAITSMDHAFIIKDNPSLSNAAACSLLQIVTERGFTGAVDVGGNNGGSGCP
ncbi:MAG: hypothetical protein AB2A00_01880 [Myxococcota bacterium]